MRWQFSTRDIEGITIVYIIEASISPDETRRDLRVAVKELLEKGTQKILVNLVNVLYMDSSRIGDLVGSYTSAQKQSAKLKLLRPQPQVHKLLAITGLTAIFDIFQDEDEAIRSFRHQKENQ
jgi:anti-sigma B factor antagonist